MKLLIVADGDRETQSLPRLVEKIIDAEVTAEFGTWSRLNLAGKGYKRKFDYAVRQAIVYGTDGIVAVVDRDRDSRATKLQVLRESRSEYREKGDLRPMALGEAIPHFEAWLLDDEVAVRTGLGLPSNMKIPNVSRVASPKDALNDLMKNSAQQEAVTTLLGRIAEQLDSHRCQHRNETGFAAFAQDCRNEFPTTSPN